MESILSHLISKDDVQFLLQKGAEGHLAVVEAVLDYIETAFDKAIEIKVRQKFPMSEHDWDTITIAANHTSLRAGRQELPVFEVGVQISPEGLKEIRAALGRPEGSLQIVHTAAYDEYIEYRKSIEPMFIKATQCISDSYLACRDGKKDLISGAEELYTQLAKIFESDTKLFTEWQINLNELHREIKRGHDLNREFSAEGNSDNVVSLADFKNPK